MTKTVRTSAPGNIFLGGEHSVVYFRPAIIAAIGYRTKTEATERDDKVVIIASRGYGEASENLDDLKTQELGVEDYKRESNTLLALKDLAGSFARQYDLNRGFELHIDSDIPRESGGMSSSTAVLSSVLAALRSLYDLGLNPQDFFDELYPFQVKIHGGAASGAEIVSSSLGGYNRVRKTESGGTVTLGERVNLGERDFYLVIGDTGRPADTATAVGKVRAAWEADKDAYEAHFDAIGNLVSDEERYVVQGDTSALGQAMNDNQRILAEDLAISSPELDRLIDASRNSGALGAKLSGGGMGGAMIALAPDTDTQTKIADAIRKAGGKAYITTVGAEGVRKE